ncbi:MAG: nagJ [Verrucomicrobiales bacterium]|nr:nagJ [Verrucomicrobiales bacterium]
MHALTLAGLRFFRVSSIIELKEHTSQSVPIDIIAGVIEGFYGQPWSQLERFQLFEWMVAWGLNTYLYAPKDDLKHRAIWRESYSIDEEQKLRELIEACKKRHLRFIYAISPGLDINYSSQSELDALVRRFEQLIRLGCRHFALLFDDIPDRMEAADRDRFGSFASAQCHIANTLFAWCRKQLPKSLFFFCPTPYCERMEKQQLGGKDYLATIGRELIPEIDVFWTGPEIISREITVAHIAELQSVLRRKPLIWDNLHANDYDGRRFFCGPYAGRPPELRNMVRGFLSNPNNEFPLNFIPLRTLGQFIRSNGSWDARNAYLAAMREWAASFGTIGTPIPEEDLILLGDCYYLPHEDGPEANLLYESANTVLHSPERGEDAQLKIFREKAIRLRACCAKLAELRDRPLFYALSRRIWELREELDLLIQFTAPDRETQSQKVVQVINSHLPGTYRGGMVSRLQRLLLQRPDGTFTSASKP